MKVLIFDIWTQGAKYTEALARLMHSEGIETKYVHIESRIRFGMPRQFHDMLSVPGMTLMESQECADIEEYDGSYLKCLEHEQPDVVVLLSTSHIANRVMIRACQRLGISTVYVMHGEDPGVKRAGELTDAWNASSRWRLLYKARKIPKFYYLLREYLAVTKSLPETLEIARQCLLKPYRFIWLPSPHRSLLVDRACVFEEKDIEGVAGRLKIPEDRMRVVGNVRFWDTRPESNDDLSSLKPYVVYVDAAYVDSGTVGKASNTAFMNELAGLAATQGYNLVIKLHPRGSMSTYADVAEPQANVVVLGADSNLHDVLKDADLVVGHYSTALKEALALRRNILCASWFDDIRGGRLFRDDNEVTCTDEREFEAMFRKYARPDFRQQFIIDRHLSNIDTNALQNTLAVIKEAAGRQHG